MWILCGFISPPKLCTSTDSHAGSLPGPLSPHAERTLVVEAVESKLEEKVFGEILYVGLSPAFSGSEISLLEASLYSKVSL